MKVMRGVYLNDETYDMYVKLQKIDGWNFSSIVRNVIKEEYKRLILGDEVPMDHKRVLELNI